MSSLIIFQNIFFALLFSQISVKQHRNPSRTFNAILQLLIYQESSNFTSDILKVLGVASSTFSTWYSLQKFFDLIPSLVHLSQLIAH